MTRKPPEPEEIVQIVTCIGCERMSFLGDCMPDGNQKLQCPRCGARIVGGSVWDMVDMRVVDYE